MNIIGQSFKFVNERIVLMNIWLVYLKTLLWFVVHYMWVLQQTQCCHWTYVHGRIWVLNYFGIRSYIVPPTCWIAYMLSTEVSALCYELLDADTYPFDVPTIFIAKINVVDYNIKHNLFLSSEPVFCVRIILNHTF